MRRHVVSFSWLQSMPVLGHQYITWLTQMHIFTWKCARQFIRNCHFSSILRRLDLEIGLSRYSNIKLLCINSFGIVFVRNCALPEMPHLLLILICSYHPWALWLHNNQSHGSIILIQLFLVVTFALETGVEITFDGVSELMSKIIFHDKSANKCSHNTRHGTAKDNNNQIFSS